MAIEKGLAGPGLLAFKPARIGFQIQANGAHYYLTDLKLNPHETRMIDIRKLRDMQKPDFKGNKIPADAADGSLVWIRLDKVPVVGRLLVLDSRKGIPSNFDCSCTNHCPRGYQDLTIDPSSATLVVGNSQQFTATEWFEDCNGFLYPYNVTSSANWSSSNFSAVTVSSSGMATAVGPGSASVVAQYSDFWYSWSVALEDCIEHARTLSAAANVTAVAIPTNFELPYPI
jgi:hypothetical protein